MQGVLPAIILYTHTIYIQVYAKKQKFILCRKTNRRFAGVAHEIYTAEIN